MRPHAGGGGADRGWNRKVGQDRRELTDQLDATVYEMRRALESLRKSVDEDGSPESEFALALRRCPGAGAWRDTTQAIMRFGSAAGRNHGCSAHAGRAGGIVTAGSGRDPSVRLDLAEAVGAVDRLVHPRLERHLRLVAARGADRREVLAGAAVVGPLVAARAADRRDVVEPPPRGSSAGTRGSEAQRFGSDVNPFCA